LAGGSATIASDALMNPFDGALTPTVLPTPSVSQQSLVIKQRMQVHKSQFHSFVACTSTVYRSEGLAAFFVSYPTTLAISIPFNAIQYTVYEQVKRFMNPRNDYSPISHITAGAIAGAIAGAVTTPLDVAKTLLQTRGTTHEVDIRNASGMLDALRIIWRRDGARGFGRGLVPRVMTIMPSTALCWLSYEFFSACTPSLFAHHTIIIILGCSHFLF